MADEAGIRTISESELEEILQRNEKNEAQLLSLELVPLAIGTLEKVCRSIKASASAKVQAAKALLDEAVGKPQTQKGALIAGDNKGLVVNILSVTGSSEHKVVDIVDVPPDERAEQILAHGQPAEGVKIRSVADEEPPDLSPW
jgi:hypothetical protein